MEVTSIGLDKNTDILNGKRIIEYIQQIEEHTNLTNLDKFPYYSSFRISDALDSIIPKANANSNTNIKEDEEKEKENNVTYK